MTATRCVAALAALLLLGGCGLVDDIPVLGGGGGGSGGGGAARDIPDSLPDPALQTADDAPTVDPDPVLEAGAEAAVARPEFGSVTQSSNSGRDGVTTHTASVGLRDGEFELEVPRKDGSILSLDTGGEHRVGVGSFESPVEGHEGRGYALFAASEDPVESAASEDAVEFAVAALYTSWDKDDPTDYLAGGYWMRLGFQIDPNSPLDLNIDVDVGAFVDGPALSGTPALPEIGTASYRGPSGGLYAYRYGAGHAAVAEGTAELGEFSGTADLKADFAADSIYGSIHGITASGIRTGPSGEETAFEAQETRARIGLNQATVDADGRFSNNTVSLEFAGRRIAPVQGSWGGRFSAVPDADGNPRLVAGTAGAEWTEQDGSQGVFLGAFFAAARP